MKFFSVALLIAASLTSTAQSHYLIGLNNDTLRGRIDQFEKSAVTFTTVYGTTKSIPHTAFSKAVVDGQEYPIMNGKLARFPFISAERAGFVYVVEVEGKSAADLYKIADEAVNSNSREFSRQADGSSVASTYAILGVKQASTQVVDMMFKNDSPVKYADPASHKIIVRVVNRYEGGGFGCVRLVWWQYDLILKFKDGRYRMELTNYGYDHFGNANMANKMQFYGMQDSGDCSSSGKIESLLGCDRCHNEFSKMYDYLTADASRLMNTLSDIISKHTEGEGDDW
jgi:hypothetical protein